MISGFLVVDKPAGITSHDVVSVLRKLLGLKKVGHTGTLDPFATGVLPMAIGSSTRLIQFLDESKKVYVGRIQLGHSTDTGDHTGMITDTQPVPELSINSVQSVAAALEGEQMQIPPRFSAVKVKGKALYKYAREGQTVEAAARPIVVHRLKVVRVGQDWIDVRVVCSRGTYVRVLAEDLSRELGTIGHLSSLRRMASGPFNLAGSIDFEALSMIAAQRPDWPRVLRPKRNESRIDWTDLDGRRAALVPRFMSAEVALSHLPRVELDRGNLDSLKLRGRTEVGPFDVVDGAHWLAYDGATLLGVMVKSGDQHRVARMLPRD